LEVHSFTSPIPPVSLFLFLINLISFDLVIGMHH